MIQYAVALFYRDSSAPEQQRIYVVDVLRETPDNQTR